MSGKTGHFQLVSACIFLWCPYTTTSDDARSPLAMRCNAQIPRGSTRHVTTRCLAHAFWHREKSWCDVTWRDDTCWPCRAARRNTHGATRVQGRRRSVDWGGHVYPEHKRLNLYTRALLLIRCPPCWNKHGATRTTSATRSSRRARRARHVVRVVSWRDAASGIWAYYWRRSSTIYSMTWASSRGSLPGVTGDRRRRYDVCFATKIQ